MTLSVARAKDRETMAGIIEAVVRNCGCAIDRDELMTRDREIWLRIVGPRGLAVTVDLDGGSRQQREGVFVLAWGIFEGPDRSARLTDAFGCAAGGSVNPHHRAKCTAVSYSFTAMVANIIAALTCANHGTAFENAIPLQTAA